MLGARASSGQWDKAEQLALAAADAGTTDPLLKLAGIRADLGQGQEDERLYQACAGLGSIEALDTLARRKSQADLTGTGSGECSPLRLQHATGTSLRS